MMEHKKVAAIGTKVLDGDQGIVEHIVAVMGNVDLGTDRIHPGAFAKTIAERGSKIKVLDGHNTQSTMDVIGKPLSMREIGRNELPDELLAEYPDATGALLVKTQYLLDTFAGKEVFARVKAKAVDEYSIGYDALDVDYTEEKIDGRQVNVRNLRTIKLYEYSPVIFAMNPATMTTDVKKDDKGASGSTDLPLADRDRAWDGDSAVAGIRRLTGSEDEPSGTYKNGFFWFDGDDPDSFGSYKLPFADDVDGELTAIPRGIFAVANAIQGGRGTGVDIPEADLARVKNRVGNYYRRMRTEFDDDGIVAPWEKGYESEPEEKTEPEDGPESEEKELGPDGPIQRFGAMLQGTIHKAFTTLCDDMYIQGFLDTDQRIFMSSLIGSALQVLEAGMPPEIAEIRMNHPGSGLGMDLPFFLMSDEQEIEEKVGRVLAERNASRISNALATLISVLEDAGIDIPGYSAPSDDEDADDTEKSDGQDPSVGSEQAPAPDGQAAKDHELETEQNDADEVGPIDESPTSTIDAESELRNVEEFLRDYPLEVESNEQ